MKQQHLNIAMAGGGTGGHVFPIRSLLETLFKTPSFASQVDKMYWFGSHNSLEEEIATTASFRKGRQGK
ncbi:MAG: glycosyltransferase [Candidatus Peribacteria bacterium]|jgi:UDP-N-acetylglucosamine:LPS N-acetylglucosamine transferase|nr:glycosyltransferase [Candidatus Peribacteria bacterium]